MKSLKLTPEEKLVMLLALDARRNNLLDTIARMPKYREYYENEIKTVDNLQKKINKVEAI